MQPPETILPPNWDFTELFLAGASAKKCKTEYNREPFRDITVEESIRIDGRPVCYVNYSDLMLAGKLQLTWSWILSSIDVPLYGLKPKISVHTNDAGVRVIVAHTGGVAHAYVLTVNRFERLLLLPVTLTQSIESAKLQTQTIHVFVNGSVIRPDHGGFISRFRLQADIRNIVGGYIPH